ncbi:MAG: hypothetical protein KAH99_06860 [Verrucomicrobia bacterium]|nr:hypothetical protein [Verrucomicrobiota bacterium]
MNREDRRENALVRIKTDLPISEWDCEMGKCIPIAAESSKGWKTFSANFPKGGQKLYVVDAAFPQRTLQPQNDEGVASMILGPFDYTLSEPNICVLDFAEFRFDGGAWQSDSEVLKIDQQIRDGHGIMRRGGEMLQPWFVAQHPVNDLCDIELRFGFEIGTMPEWIDLVIEEPENFTVDINGQSLDLSNSGFWIDIAFHRIRIPAQQLRRGKNEIILQTCYTENSNLEAIYLLGEFGVELDGIRRTLVPMVGKVGVGDLCCQGFPFYSAAITYKVPIPEDASRLSLPGIGAACAKVNGQVLGWDPFEADVSACGEMVDVEIILTRRNTFGSLHDAVPDRQWIGPVNFVTEGAEFSEECILIESGLLAPPEVSVGKAL